MKALLLQENEEDQKGERNFKRRGRGEDEIRNFMAAMKAFVSIITMLYRLKINTMQRTREQELGAVVVFYIDHRK